MRSLTKQGAGGLQEWTTGILHGTAWLYVLLRWGQLAGFAPAQRRVVGDGGYSRMGGGTTLRQYSIMEKKEREDKIYV
jgi:hypothetical protein